MKQMIVLMLLTGLLSLHATRDRAAPGALLFCPSQLPAQVACLAGGQVREAEAPRQLANQQGMVFVRIPAGTFVMGPENRFCDERPPHRVAVSKAFYLQTTEVTQGQWRAVMGSNPAVFAYGGNHPVERVSWQDVQSFLEKLNAMDPGKNYRLPTEAEWEYACRAAGDEDPASELDNIAWHRGNAGERTHPVGGKRPNAWGLYDMLGNVWEWCADWYGEDYYARSPTSDPRGPSWGQDRVMRGGSWASVAVCVRSGCRNGDAPNTRLSIYGFRCARD